MSESKECWHLDKRVPIALIVTLFLQTASIVWWASSLSERVTALESWRTDNRLTSERLVRLETILDRIDKRLADMELRR